MPIDPSKVKWDDAPAIDPSKVQWDQPAPKSNGAGPSRIEKLTKGMRDPLDGGAQLLTHLWPSCPSAMCPAL